MSLLMWRAVITASSATGAPKGANSGGSSSELVSARICLYTRLSFARSSYMHMMRLLECARAYLRAQELCALRKSRRARYTPWPHPWQ